MSNKPDEKIEILIDPDTLDYSLECSNTYIEDIYIVLREITYSLEQGDLTGVFRMEDQNGNPASNEQVRNIIEELKRKVDTELEKQEEGATNHLVRDFRN